MALNAIDQAWVRPNLVSYGHSFLAETGLDNEADYYGRRLAAFGEMTYLKRAVGGSLIESAVNVMLTGNPWIAGTNKVLLIQGLINTARKNGADPATRRGAEHALRTMCALGSSMETIEEDTPFFDYSGTWNTNLDGEFHGGACKSTAVVGSYVEFTVPAYGSHFLSVARKVGLAGATIQFRRLDTGAVFKTWTNLEQAQADISRNYVPAAISMNVPAGTRVRATLTASSSGATLVCDGLIVPSTQPTAVLLMKEPHLLDYSHSEMFPNGSDAALDYFNSILDTMANEFSNVIVADPNTAGYWDKAHDILPDGVHPNSNGHLALYATMLEAIHKTLSRKAYEGGLR